MEVIKVTDKADKASWKGVVVSTFDAMRRVEEDRRARRCRKQPKRERNVVVQTDHGPGAEFKFSLAQGELIELTDRASGERRLYVVAKVTKRGEGRGERATVGIVGVNDARPSTAKEKGKSRELYEPSAEVLRNANCRKVVVTPLGEVRTARD